MRGWGGFHPSVCHETILLPMAMARPGQVIHTYTGWVTARFSLPSLPYLLRYLGR